MPLYLQYVKVSTNIIMLGIDLAYYIIYQADGKVTQIYRHYHNNLLCKATHETTHLGYLALFKTSARMENFLEKRNQSNLRKRISSGSGKALKTGH